MELKDRIRLILNERQMRQKELANMIKVTESYISNIVQGKRKNILKALALLIEQTCGYSAQWVLTGEGERYASGAANPELSPAKKLLFAESESMSKPALDAVQVFIDSLDRYRQAFQGGDGE